jgi:hypothetical protein
VSKLLVTGSSGLIGSEVVTYFDAQGWEVHGIDNKWQQKCRQLSLDWRFVVVPALARVSQNVIYQWVIPGYLTRNEFGTSIALGEVARQSPGGEGRAGGCG